MQSVLLWLGEDLLDAVEAPGNPLEPDHIVQSSGKGSLRLTEMVIETALGQIGEWDGNGLNLKVDINLSLLSLDDIELPDKLAASCQEFGASPDRFAKSLGLSCCAEGVETAATVDFCRRNGCDKLQGYYVSKPLPGADARRFIEHWDPEIGLLG